MTPARCTPTGVQLFFLLIRRFHTRLIGNFHA